MTPPSEEEEYDEDVDSQVQVHGGAAAEGEVAIADGSEFSQALKTGMPILPPSLDLSALIQASRQHTLQSHRRSSRLLGTVDLPVEASPSPMEEQGVPSSTSEVPSFRDAHPPHHVSFVEAGAAPAPVPAPPAPPASPHRTSARRPSSSRTSGLHQKSRAAAEPSGMRNATKERISSARRTATSSRSAPTPRVTVDEMGRRLKNLCLSGDVPDSWDAVHSRRTNSLSLVPSTTSNPVVEPDVANRVSFSARSSRPRAPEGRNPYQQHSSRPLSARSAPDAGSSLSQRQRKALANGSRGAGFPADNLVLLSSRLQLENRAALLLQQNKIPSSPSPTHADSFHRPLSSATLLSGGAGIFLPRAPSPVLQKQQQERDAMALSQRKAYLFGDYGPPTGDCSVDVPRQEFHGLTTASSTADSTSTHLRRPASAPAAKKGEKKTIRATMDRPASASVIRKPPVPVELLSVQLEEDERQERRGRAGYSIHKEVKFVERMDEDAVMAGYDSTEDDPAIMPDGYTNEMQFLEDVFEGRWSSVYQRYHMPDANKDPVSRKRRPDRDFDRWRGSGPPRHRFRDGRLDTTARVRPPTVVLHMGSHGVPRRATRR